MNPRRHDEQKLDEDFMRIMVEELRGGVAEEVLLPEEPIEIVDDAAMETLIGSGDSQLADVQEPLQVSLPERELLSDVAQRATSRWQLRVHEEGKPERVMLVRNETITIGRRQDNVLLLKCDRISRVHAQVWLEDHGPRIKDLDSRNGFRLNGIKTTESYLHVNDVIRLGSVVIYVEDAS